MVRIRRLGVVKTATVAAVVYLLLTSIIVLPLVLIGASAGPITFTDQSGRTVSMEVPIGILLLAPILYAGIGWVLTAIACLIYNLAAAITGGAELEIVQDRPAAVAHEPPPAPAP
jgi:hypothetical protein